jgi:two-component system, sensor histidine kinase and response regulator
MANKILVIEDDPAILTTMLDALSLEGFDTTGAENGRIGLQRVQDYQPDLIISDIMMPDLDGHEVLTHLRNDPATATIPLIFLTAKTSRTDVRQGMTLGADDYLTKPFTTDELLTAVSTQLSKRAALAELADKRLEELRQTIILTLPHELRTPLTSILGFAQILVNDAQTTPPERIADMATRIVKAGQRLQRLIENYLVYAQLEMTSTNPEWLQALQSKCTGNAQLIIRNQATVKARQVNREADLVLSSEAIPQVQISEYYLAKIVLELVDNAFKFSKAGTPVYAFATLQDDRVVLRVTDRGRGMTREQIADIGAYMQFNRKIHEQQGSGFGLIIAKRLAELHNGELTIESTLQPQTTVSVALPLGTPDCMP